MPPEPRERMHVVPDVNVIISSVITPSGPPGRIYAAWKRRELYFVTSPIIVAKVVEVLRRPYIRDTYPIGENDIQEIRLLLERRTILTPHTLDLRVISGDREDDTIIIAAVEGGADCIISGDKHLKALGSYQGIPILSPVEFVTQYNIP